MVPEGAWLLIVRRGDEAVPVVTSDKAEVVVVPDRWDPTGDESLRSALARGPRYGCPDPDEVAAALQRRAAAQGEIAGRVVGADGRPIAGAEIIAVSPGTSLDPLASLLIPDRRPWCWEPFAQTDAAGRFVIRHLTAGTYLLQAAAPHLVPVLSAPMTVPADGRTVAFTIELHPGASLILIGATEPRLHAEHPGKWAWGYGPRDPGEVIDGLPEGPIKLAPWVTRCGQGDWRTVEIPRSGTVEVDFGKPEDDPNKRRRIGRR